MTDVSTLSLDELKKLQKDVAKAIESFEERARKKALAEADAVVRQHGFTIDQLFGKAPKATRAAVAPKYANPSDPSQTWTGRGRKPRWIIAELESGKTLEDMSI
ncbi:DNA-binding protein H-NS [Roseinatronobacter thiooxidans]|uniref:DNA-binding protein H-NS n=1 Tax=Roseinatronobacter thiooxidans TaxID=121821 RepID=A0A2W7Q2R9_9RHOB|nr:H-NS histone family protein [Roseinatronobacter thiooxidans]PZX41976.1 DNA-binding protein H-NS [Roseinatronobacter thiooxidans]